MSVPDVRDIPPQTRLAIAERVRTAGDFTLPELEWFNSEPCAAHASIDEGAQASPPCRACGVRFRRHQRVGVAWLYLRGRGLIGDQVGTGKTAQAAGLLALCKQNGELDAGPALVVCRPSALMQWVDELNRYLPKLVTVAAVGDKRSRAALYGASFDVLVIGYQMLVNDLEQLVRADWAAVVVDDVDPLRHHANRTAYAVKRIARTSQRAVVLTATALQKDLLELHSVLEPVGGFDVLGTATHVRRRFVREEMVKIYNPRAGRFVHIRKTVGYRNLDEFAALIAPLVLRRTPAHIDDVELPAITPHTVWLDLYPAQAAHYAELQKGVRKILKEEGAKVKHTKAVGQLLHGAQICSGLATLGEPDGPGTSSKLDWVMSALDGDLVEEKVVVFCQFTNTVAALAARLHTAGIGHSVIWGRQPDKAVRATAIRRFWDEPACRVLIGTSAIEQSLNLQVSRHLINVDQIMNPARMGQLAGRIRRDGSAFRTVYIHNLLARGTQEEGYLSVLAREQALADHVWDESSELYEKLNSLALLDLIGHSGRRPR